MNGWFHNDHQRLSFYIRRCKGLCLIKLLHTVEILWHNERQSLENYKPSRNFRTFGNVVWAYYLLMNND